MFQASDLIFNQELLPLDLGNFKIVGTRVVENLVKLVLQGLVPLFEFNEMRLHRHQDVSSICDSYAKSLLETARLSTRIPPHRDPWPSHGLYGL